jgi:hypothetical protein
LPLRLAALPNVPKLGINKAVPQMVGLLFSFQGLALSRATRIIIGVVTWIGTTVNGSLTKRCCAPTRRGDERIHPRSPRHPELRRLAVAKDPDEHFKSNGKSAASPTVVV